MKVSLVILSILAVGYDAVRIDTKKNMEIQKSCGKKSTGYSRKVINGELAKPGDHPWAASVYVRVKNHTTGDYNTLLGPGTVISEHHILAYNTIRMSNNKKLSIIKVDVTDFEGTCDGDHLIIPKAMNSRYDVDFEHFEKFNAQREFTDSIARITVINGCKYLSPANVLVIELKKPLEIGTKERTAACISNSPRNWFKPSQFPVYGMNRPGLLVSGKFAPTNCSSSEPFACATAVEKTQGLCQGDFGGSAVANLEGRYTILGLYVNGNTRCLANPATLPEFHFVNTGFYREEICKVTGVCVAPPAEDVSHIPPFGDYTTTGKPVSTTNSTIPEYDETRTPRPEEETTPEDYVETTEEPEFTTTPDETAETRTEPLDESAYTRGPEEDTTTRRATTAPRIGAPGEVIVAETYEQMPLGGAGSPEVINAERIAPMQIGNFTGNSTITRGGRANTVNINIHFH